VEAKEALKAIALLQDASRGKANFFILSKLKEYAKPQAKSPDATPAMSLVEYDEKYENLIQYLLGEVYLTADPEPTSGNDKYHLLDTEGKITHRPFSISGGSIGLFEGKRIGRAKNLEKLEVEIRDLKKDQGLKEKEVETLQKRLEELSLSSKTSHLEDLKEQLSRTNEMLVSVRTKQEQFSELLSSNKHRREDIKEQIGQLEKDLEELRPRLETQNQSLLELEQTLQAKRANAEELQAELEKKSSSFNAENVLFHQKKNRLDSILQEISFKEESYQNALGRIERNREDLETASSNLNELVKKSTESDDDLVSMYEEKESLESGVNEAEKEYYEARTLIDEEEKNLRETQRRKEGIDQVLMDWQNRLNEAKIGLNSISDRLAVEFNIDLAQVKDEVVADYQKFTIDELRSKVDKLRNRLDNMGPINPMAMEAFEEIKERHTFISEQKADLLEAKESLLTTIGEIDEVAKTTFMEAFQEIKENFIKVFRTLFTEEDDCDLILTDPDHPLESSIDIIAKPKGKRPLTINQLSGGEKTLTATSLLFSIYLIKPAPFCIFDEVDAPLDDANIDKFNEIIRKFSTESQFIIVTHNKRTMASTDIIYGVTMQEQGVSKVVPVDLRELS